MSYFTISCQFPAWRWRNSLMNYIIGFESGLFHLGWNMSECRGAFLMHGCCAWESAGTCEHGGRNIKSLRINIWRLQAVKLTLGIEMKGNALRGAISSCCGLCVCVCKVGGSTALPVYTRELISALDPFFFLARLMRCDFAILRVRRPFNLCELFDLFVH